MLHARLGEDAPQKKPSAENLLFPEHLAMNSNLRVNTTP